MSLPTPSPEQLLGLARAGDRIALGQLLEGYLNYLSLLARLGLGRKLQSKVDPLDLVQETFLQAHRKFAQFQGSTAEELIAWLRQILASRLNKLRRRYWAAGRDIRREQDLADQLAQSSRMLDQVLAAPHSSPSQRAARGEQAVLLANTLKRLPEDYREVIILRQMEDLSFAEVAVRMRRSVDSVKKLWVRALSHLRRLQEGVS